MAVRTVAWADGRLDVVDQTALPELRRTTLSTVDEVVDAVRQMVVRGAPALGVVGGYAVALAAQAAADRPEGCRLATVRADAERVAAARPTAVNLRRGVDRVLVAASAGPAAALAAAHALAEENVAACRELSVRGARLLRELCGPAPLRLHTHCNAGALACVEWGSALGVVRELHAAGGVAMVVVDETRPLLQGARITATELAGLGVDHRVVVDGAGAGLIARGFVDAVVVGADRVAANGDVANKVGTYPLALAAARTGIPFVVAAPESTLDRSTPDGSAIEVEERDGDEVLVLGGRRTAPTGTAAWNPAFDLTPADLVTAVVTERRVIRPSAGERL